MFIYPASAAKRIRRIDHSVFCTVVCTVYCNLYCCTEVCTGQGVEDEKLKMRRQVSELQQQLQQVESSSASSRQQLLSTQQMLSSKINELYEMNDKLADLLQASNLA